MRSASDRPSVAGAPPSGGGGSIPPALFPARRRRQSRRPAGRGKGDRLMPVNQRGRDFVVLAPEATGREPETFTSATSGDIDGSDPTHRGAWIHEPIAVVHYLQDGAVLITPPPGCTGHMEAWHRHPDLSDPDSRYWQDRSGVEVRLDHQGETCPVHEAGERGRDDARQ